MLAGLDLGLVEEEYKKDDDVILKIEPSNQRDSI